MIKDAKQAREILNEILNEKKEQTINGAIEKILKRIEYNIKKYKTHTMAYRLTLKEIEHIGEIRGRLVELGFITDSHNRWFHINW